MNTRWISASIFVLGSLVATGPLGCGGGDTCSTGPCDAGATTTGSSSAATTSSANTSSSSSTSVGTGGAGGHGSTSGGGGAGGNACELDPPGDTFTFHITNAGSSALRLTYDCGDAPSLVLDTPGGPRQISPGDATYCGTECKELYSQDAQLGCSDCSGGYGSGLGPGMTVDLPWKRLLYRVSKVPAACSKKNAGVNCTLGETAPMSATQKGTLMVCADGQMGGPNGECEMTERKVDFTIDTTKTEGTIKVD